MEALDTTIINVALPQMGGNLGATPNEIGWVSTGYILSVVIVLPLTAWLAARFGRKRYLVTSILLFILASFFCGTSRSLGELVFWRVLPGRRRRRAAVHGPGHAAGDLPVRAAGHGAVHLRPGRRRRPRRRAHAGRLADRQLLLALGLLRQPAHRPGLRVPRHHLSGGLAVPERLGGERGLGRDRPAGGRPRLAPIRLAGRAAQ